MTYFSFFYYKFEQNHSFGKGLEVGDNHLEELELRKTRMMVPFSGIFLLPHEALS